MSRGVLKFRWEDWREITGGSNPRQRRLIDEFRQRHPAILYWGDSWFSSPLDMNLARQSFAAIRGLGMVVGKPGATAARLFSRSDVPRIGDRVRDNKFDVVVLSAGGNDTLSDNLKKVFAPWHERRPPAKIDVPTAFAHFSQAALLAGIRGRYELVLDRFAQVRRRHPDLQVVGHGYTRLLRIGKAADLTLDNIGLIALLKGDVGPWLWSAMAPVLHDTAAGKAFASLMLEAFRREVLQALVADPRYTAFFSFVDFLDEPEAAQEAFWNDEIHPTSAGFAILGRRLNRHIRDRLPAAKQGAIDV